MLSLNALFNLISSHTNLQFLLISLKILSIQEPALLVLKLDKFKEVQEEHN